MNKSKRLLCLILALMTVLSMSAVGFTASAADLEMAEVSAATPTSANDFTWDNATVYFLLTDRFNNGNTSNDNSYNRNLNEDGSKGSFNNVAAFQGGDFKGITKKINDGYFDDLGVNAIWVAGWFEQTHGYVVGGDGKKSFPHYSYHGYYGLDFTELDKNYGTETEFKEMIDTAHKHGIRIVLDVVLNHPGYNSVYDMAEYNFGTLNSNWKNVYYKWNEINQSNYHSLIKYNDGQASDWARWWGRDWIRAGMAGYDNNGGGDLTGAVAYLPDFKTENTATVNIPEILKTKWNKEGTYNAKVNEINQTFTKYNLGNKTVLNYLVSWYAKWVEEYGIDGFRCDTAKHVDVSCWKKLNEACTKALQNWRKANPSAVGANWDEDFWMTGENFGQGLSKNHYYQNGFDSMINFEFSGNSQGGGCDGLKKTGDLNNTYQNYANQINNDANFNALTYISSHDTGLCRNDLYYQGSALLLLPGGVQIYYGDETNRQYVECSIHDHESRSFMNWSNMDNKILAHWQKVGSFRNNHIAVGAGAHKTLKANSGIAFARTYNKNGVNDAVACVIGANKNASITITLNGTFADGTKVINTYTGDKATVSGGQVTFKSGEQGTILVEADTTVPETTVAPTTTQAPTTQAPTTTVAPTTQAPKPTVPVTTQAPKPTVPVTTQAPKPTTPATTIEPDTSEIIIVPPVPTTGTDPKETTTIIEPSETVNPTNIVVTPAEYVILGDSDLNDKVNIKDATLIQKVIANLEIISEKAEFAAEVDGNEKVNIKDVTNIQKWVANYEIEYKIGEEVLYKEAVTAPAPTTTQVATTEAKPTETDAPEVTTAAPTTAAPTTAAPTTAAPTTAVPTTVAPTTTEAPVYTDPATEPITDPIYTDPIPADTYTVYFKNNKGWGEVYWHAWNTAGGTSTPWPGDLMENVGNNVFKAVVSTEFTDIIFNDGSNNAANKTIDTVIPGDGQIFDGSSWAPYDPNNNNNNGGGENNDGTITIYVNNSKNWGSVYCHAWNGSSGTVWPGTPMENIGNNVFKISIDASYTGIVFNNGNGDQTGDIIPAGSGQIYDLNSGSWSAYSDNGGNNGGDNGGGDVTGGYIYFQNTQGWGTVYCHTWNTAGGTTTWPGTQMELVDGVYRAMVDGSHTAVIFNDGNGTQLPEAALNIGQTY